MQVKNKPRVGIRKMCLSWYTGLHGSEEEQVVHNSQLSHLSIRIKVRVAGISWGNLLCTQGAYYKAKGDHLD
jgi:hypothetical protein